MSDKLSRHIDKASDPARLAGAGLNASIPHAPTIEVKLL